MTLKFDGYESEPLALAKGLDQGCPLSGVAFQLYNADLLDIPDVNNGEEVVAFMDDALMLACGKTIQESNRKVRAITQCLCMESLSTSDPTLLLNI